MGYGRLVRAKQYRGDPKGVAYIVAIADPNEAMQLIRERVAVTGDEVEDLGRVSEALLTALDLQPGGFIRADSTHKPNNLENRV